MTGGGDEFAEIEMSEDEFDQEFAEGEPVEIVGLPPWLTERSSELYRLVNEPVGTYAGSQGIIASTPYFVEAEVSTNAVTQRELVRP